MFTYGWSSFYTVTVLDGRRKWRIISGYSSPQRCVYECDASRCGSDEQDLMLLLLFQGHYLADLVCLFSKLILQLKTLTPFDCVASKALHFGSSSIILPLYVRYSELQDLRTYTQERKRGDEDNWSWFCLYQGRTLGIGLEEPWTLLLPGKRHTKTVY